MQIDTRQPASIAQEAGPAAAAAASSSRVRRQTHPAAGAPGCIQDEPRPAQAAACVLPDGASQAVVGALQATAAAAMGGECGGVKRCSRCEPDIMQGGFIARCNAPVLQRALARRPGWRPAAPGGSARAPADPSEDDSGACSSTKRAKRLSILPCVDHCTAASCVHACLAFRARGVLPPFTRPVRRRAEGGSQGAVSQHIHACPIDPRCTQECRGRCSACGGRTALRLL